MEAESSLSPVPLNYAKPRRLVRLRRWIGPGSAGFFLLVLAIAGAGTWGAWKWRLKADEKAFHERVVNDISQGYVIFVKPPNAASLRHLNRLPGIRTLYFEWPSDPDASAPRALRGCRLPPVTRIVFQGKLDVDPCLKELARSDSTLMSLTSLKLHGTPVTDAGLKELARPDSGLKALASLDLSNTAVTDAGLKELAGPDSGLTALVTLDLFRTKVTDAGLKELARSDNGLKVLTSLHILDTKVTELGIAALKKARPGLKISR